MGNPTIKEFILHTMVAPGRGRLKLARILRSADVPPKPKRLEPLYLAMRARHDSVRTEDVHVMWNKRIVFFPCPEIRDATSQGKAETLSHGGREFAARPTLCQRRARECYIKPYNKPKEFEKPDEFVVGAKLKKHRTPVS